jgi:hypothetical protein
MAIDAAERELTVEQREERVSLRIRDVVFWLFFAAYAVGGIAVLIQGAGAVAAHISEQFHDTLHLRALAGTDYSARVAQRMADASHSLPSPLSIGLGYAFSILNLTLATFLLWLRPRDRTARLLAIGAVGTAGVFNLAAQQAYEALPLLSWEGIVQTAAAIIAAVSYALALVMFPDGLLVPRWKRPQLVVLYAPFLAGIVFLALRMQERTRPVALLFAFGLAVPITGVAAQAYRFRRAQSQLEYTQARLLFWALLPPLGIGAYFVVAHGVGDIAASAQLAGRGLPADLTALRIFTGVFILVPVALVSGLVRYRLWDIDRVVNRTLVYGIVTGLGVGAYFVFVILFQRLLSPFTGSNDVAIAASTLAAAGAAVPLRRRIQNFVDRRFYRQRYDAQRTIEAFSSRLRDELDLEALAFELRGAAVRTMQPSHLTLLLKDEDGAMQWQWTYRGRQRE